MIELTNEARSGISLVNLILNVVTVIVLGYAGKLVKDLRSHLAWWRKNFDTGAK